MLANEMTKNDLIVRKITGEKVLKGQEIMLYYQNK